MEHGRTEIHVPHWDGIEQQHGFVHGGVVGMIADSAAGYAAMSIVAANASVSTVEYKIDLVAPADGEKLIARGQVVRPGRTLIVTKADVFAVKDGKETLCALMQQTIIVMQGKIGITTARGSASWRSPFGKIQAPRVHPGIGLSPVPGVVIHHTMPGS